MQDIGEYVAACPVCAQNKTLNSLRASYARYPYPSVRGRTLHWTLSRDCHHPQVTLLYSRSLYGFQRQSTLWPYRSFHLPWRLLSFSPNTCSGSTASFWTSSLTGVPSSLPRCGRSSVLSWGPRLACHRDSLLKPTIRQNGLIRNWKQCCVVSSSPTHRLGASSSRGWNMLTIPARHRKPPDFSFEASLGYQPPLLSVTEGELAVPSVQLHMRRCRKAWRAARVALLRAK